MTKPSVTVLMSVYNERPEFLHEAVSSIIAQTYQDWEFLIIDDGSDNAETLRTLSVQRRRDPRVHLFTEPHRGLTKALNLGLSLAQAELICRQDSDDWSEPERIAKQVQFLETYPSMSMVGSNCVWHQENGVPLWVSDLPTLPQDVLAAFPSGNPFAHGSVCFRTSHALAFGGYREALDVAQDYDLFWRLCESAGGANLVEPLYHYRISAAAVSTAWAWKQTQSTLIVRHLAEMRSAGHTEDLELAFRQARISVSEAEIEATNLRQADRLMLAGHYREAVGVYLRFIHTRPTSGLGYIKLIRWAAYLSVPPARKRLFRRL